MDLITKAEVDRERCQAELDRLRSQIAALTAELTKLNAAKREHEGQKGDDRCWLDDLKLYAAFDGSQDPYEPDFALPPKPDFLESCGRYWEQRQPEGVKGARSLPGCMTIAQLTAEVERLTAANAALRGQRDRAVSVARDFALFAEIEDLQRMISVADPAEAERVGAAVFGGVTQ